MAIRFRPGTLSPDEALDHLEERLLVVILLDDVRVGALLGAAALVILAAHRGDHHHGQRTALRVVPDGLEQLKSVHLRHLDVGQHHVDPAEPPRALVSSPPMEVPLAPGGDPPPGSFGMPLSITNPALPGVSMSVSSTSTPPRPMRSSASAPLFAVSTR